MGDEALREQFKLLQEQKRKKLVGAAKSNKKNDSKLGNSNKNDDTNKSEYIKSDGINILNEIDENLDLQLGSSTIQHANNIKDTDDYKDLLETVQELRDENGRLDKLLGEKEEEIKILRKRHKAEKEELAGGGIGSGNAASKIIEFSKKIRELNTALGKEKSKTQSLEKNIAFIERNTEGPVIKPQPSKEEMVGIETELTTVKDKLNHSLMKCAEGKSEIDLLKKELKIAQKVLNREIGENVSFQSLINGSSGWRGRQQQIMGLQLKVAELEQQIDRSSGGSLSSRNALLSGISQHDEKHRLVMRKIELERKEQQDKLQKELASIKIERDSYKEKNSAARARNKIITQDIKSLKDRLNTLVDKGKHDDELVSALLREQQYLKEENEKLKTDISLKESNEVERIFKASGQFSLENAHTDDLVSKLKDEIKIQEDRVKELEGELSHLRSTKGNRSNQSLIPRPLSSCSKNERLSVKNFDVNNYNYKGQESPNLLLQETKSLCEAANVEKEKLGELVQVLQGRNEELMKELLEKDLLFSEYRNSNMELQKRIEKLSLSQNNASHKGSSGAKSLSKIKRPDTSQSKIDEMEANLHIQMDNNDALKSALEETLRAKEEDSKYYHQMIEQTKNIFLQGLRQYRQVQDK